MSFLNKIEYQPILCYILCVKSSLLRLSKGINVMFQNTDQNNEQYDILCTGMALVDSIIKGFDPEPISASGYRAASGSLNVGGEAVNEAVG